MLYSVSKNFLVYTGRTFGLRLTINVEEYEYMAGAHIDTGIKVKSFPLAVSLFHRDN